MSLVNSTDVLQAIVPFRQAGFALHWLRARSKAPVSEGGWSEAPVASIHDLRATYQPGYNIGVRLGEPSKIAGDYYLYVLDLDIRIADLADEAWEAFARLFPDISPLELPCVVSGSGGESRHLYFLSDKPLYGSKLAVSEGKHRRYDKRVGRDVWSYDWEIELFGTGKQVAMPPSIHPETSKSYYWLREFDFDALLLGMGPVIPAAVIEVLGVAETSTYEFETREPLTFEPGQMERDLSLLPDGRLDDYHDWITLGQALHHQFGGSDAGFNIWVEQSKRSSKFDNDLKTMLRKWRGFGKNRRKPVTMATIRTWAQEGRTAALKEAFDEEDEYDDRNATPFTKVGDSPFETLFPNNVQAEAVDPIDAAMSTAATAAANAGKVIDPITELLNRKHAIAMVRGKAIAITEHKDGSVDFGTVTDLHTFYANKQVPAGEKKTEPASQRWLRDPNRRTYPQGVAFAPGASPAGKLNLWRGWAVDPKATASCEQFLEHVRHVVCRGNDDHYQYIIGWMAHMIQRPQDKPGVALVLKGVKGAGKDTVAEYLARVVGQRHAPTVAESTHIVGKFNARLEAALLLHVQEGSWAGDRKAEGVLKYLVTSDRVEIERKGIDSINLPSVLRIFISANADWVVPASPDERRWAVFNVSNSRKNDHSYFDALRGEMDSDGPAALLHYLQNYDLSVFNVRYAPETDGLRDQKIASLRNIDRWWYDVLNRGALSGGMDSGSSWAESHIIIGRDHLRNQYVEWMKGQRFDGETLIDIHFGRRLRAMMPDIKDKRTRDGHARERQYIVPILPSCRTAFDQWLGAPVEWEG